MGSPNSRVYFIIFIDQHLAESGIAPLYTNVFWGGRSEIKPSEISPLAYRDWCKSVGIDSEGTIA